MHYQKKRIKHQWMLSTLILVGVALLSSCQSHKQAGTDVASSPSVVILPDTVAAIQCESPRSQLCTREYRPVCASRDIGVRCVTVPCPSSETVTKSNACTACADEKVSSYVEGVCR